MAFLKAARDRRKICRSFSQTNIPVLEIRHSFIARSDRCLRVTIFARAYGKSVPYSCHSSSKHHDDLAPAICALFCYAFQSSRNYHPGTSDVRLTF